MIGSKLTTVEAAKSAGIHEVTLRKWIAARKVKAPNPTLIGAVGYRLWSAKDICRFAEGQTGHLPKGQRPKEKRQPLKLRASTAT